MVDYLYQLDYDVKTTFTNGVGPRDESELNHIPEAEAESPVAMAIERFEDMVAVPMEEEQDWSPPRKKKYKKKRESASSWTSAYLSPAISEPMQANGIASHESNESELSIHAQMYALAEKYGIHDLKDLARDKFEEAASKQWNGSGFPLAVQIVYTSTPESDHGLRDVVVDTLGRHRQLLEKAEVEALVMEINGLAFGLLKSAWGL
jgi:hypothetical protein